MTFEEFAAARLPALLRFAVVLTGGAMFSWDPARQGAHLILSGAGGVNISVENYMLSQTQPVGQPVMRQVRDGMAASVNVGPFEAQVTSAFTPRLSDEQVERIARSITPAGSMSDPSTWIPAVEALPAT